MSFIRVPPDSTGKRVNTKESLINGDLVQTQVVHVADSQNPNQHQAIDRRGSSSVRFAEGQPVMSGFGSLKVAHQRALGVYESSQGSYEDLFSLFESGGGSITYSPVSSSEILSVDGLSGSRAAVLTNRYHYYLPGTSNFINMTISCGDTGKTGNVRRWGAFDSNDGVFFELNGTVLNAVIRSSTTGSVVETKVPQSSWNRDALNVNSLSGITIDLTKINVWWIDYQWLGAGRVRFGIYEPNGARLVCHEFENAGQHSLPYMRTGTLPLAVENVNVGATGSSSEIRSVCMAIYAEGDFDDYTFWRASDLENSISVTQDISHQTVMALRSKPDIDGKRNSVVTYPEKLNVYSNHPVELTFWQNVDILTGTWNMTTDSSVEGSSDATLAYTNARKFTTIYFDAGARQISLTELFEKNDEGIQLKADNQPEYWALTARRLDGNNATVKVNLCYRELW